MPSSPYSRYSSSSSAPAVAPWQLPAKSSAHPPSVHRHGSNQDSRPTRYMPGSAAPYPPSSPSLTTGGATYSIPGSSYSPTPSSSSRSRTTSRHQSFASSSSGGSMGLGISGIGTPQDSSVDVLDYMSDRLSSSSSSATYSYAGSPSSSSAGSSPNSPTSSSSSSSSSTATPSPHPSTNIHAKSLELAALQHMTRARLAAAKVNFADGVAAARETRRDLEWASQRVGRLRRKMSDDDDGYADAYWRVEGRVPRIVDDED